MLPCRLPRGFYCLWKPMKARIWRSKTIPRSSRCRTRWRRGQYQPPRKRRSRRWALRPAQPLSTRPRPPRAFIRCFAIASFRARMLVREYTEADLDALRAMHASQGFDYPFPDLADPIFVSKLVLEDGAGRPVMASLARHEAGERDLLARGLDDAHAWLPPSIARRFGRRLEALGWVRDDAWTPYCRALQGTG